MREIINFVAGICDHLEDLCYEASYARSVVEGEETYNPEYTRGNKLLKFADEKLYNEQLKQCKNKETTDDTDFDIDRFGGKTAERNM